MTHLVSSVLWQKQNQSCSLPTHFAWSQALLLLLLATPSPGHKIDLCVEMQLTGGGGCAGNYTRLNEAGKAFGKRGGRCGFGQNAVVGLDPKRKAWTIAPSLGSSPFFIGSKNASGLVFLPTASYKEQIDRDATALRPKCISRLTPAPTPSPAKAEQMRVSQEQTRACTSLSLDTNGSAIVKPCLGRYSLLASKFSAANPRAVFKSEAMVDCPDAGHELRTLFIRFDDRKDMRKWVISNSMVPSKDADSGVGCLMMHVDEYAYEQLGTKSPIELTHGKWMYCDTEREMKEHPREIGRAFDGQENSVGLRIRVSCARQEQLSSVLQALFVPEFLIPPPSSAARRVALSESHSQLQLQCTVLSFEGIDEKDPQQQPYLGCMGYYVRAFIFSNLLAQSCTPSLSNRSSCITKARATNQKAHTQFDDTIERKQSRISREQCISCRTLVFEPAKARLACMRTISTMKQRAKGTGCLLRICTCADCQKRCLCSLH